jgi:hypothetical protein
VGLVGGRCWPVRLGRRLTVEILQLGTQLRGLGGEHV